MPLFLHDPIAGPADGDALPFCDNRRLFPRAAIIWAARFVTATASHDCVLLNISAGGARLRSRFPPEIGVRGRLIIDRCGSFDAEIVWVQGRHIGAGLRFQGTPADVTRTFVQS